MQVIRLSSGVRGFVRLNAYAVRWAQMIAKTAKERTRILAFWKQQGLKATMDAFTVKRSTLYTWQAQLKKGEGKLEALNPKKTTPKTVRRRTRE